VKQHFAVLAQRVDDEIAFTDGAAAGEYQDVASARPLDCV
jgi:hypothetical protein